MTSNTITIRLIERGETTVEVDANEYTEAKAAGELDMLLDAWASDIDGETVIVEPDGTRLAFSTSKPIEPPRAADLPVGSIVATSDTVYIRRDNRNDYAMADWYGMGPIAVAVMNNQIDALIADEATVLRVGDGT